MSALCSKCRRPMLCGQKVMHLSCCPRCLDCPAGAGVSAPAVDGPLTIAERDSIRRMVGWQPEWAEYTDGRRSRDPEVVDREKRMRAWFRREGIDPMQTLPRGSRQRAITELGVSSEEAFDWSLRRIRARPARRVPRKWAPEVAARARLVGEHFAAAGVDPAVRLPKGAITGAAAELGLTYSQVEHAVLWLREAS